MSGAERDRESTRTQQLGSLGRRGSVLPILGLLLATVAVGACRSSSDEDGAGQDAKTVDVESRITVDVENDQRAEAPVASLTGVLPGNFPDDLPLYLPASLIDFGPTSQGLESVSLLCPHSLSRVRRGFDDLLSKAGWSVDAGASSGDALRLSKGGRQVWLRLEDGNPGTLYRYEY